MRLMSVGLSTRSPLNKLFDVINLIAFKHMLVRPRDIGYYRKKGDRSSLHSLLDKFNCPSTSKPPLRQRDAFLRLELSVDHRLPAKNYTTPPWYPEICYVLSQNDDINHFQMLPSTLCYSVMKNRISFQYQFFI